VESDVPGGDTDRRRAERAPDSRDLISAVLRQFSRRASTVLRAWLTRMEPPGVVKVNLRSVSNRMRRARLAY
jgi:hypothetical protein